MSPHIDDGGSAFPEVVTNQVGSHGEYSSDTHSIGGMSLRDYFAAHAPDAPEDFGWAGGETDCVQRIIRWRYYYADLMIKARNS